MHIITFFMYKNACSRNRVLINNKLSFNLVMHHFNINVILPNVTFMDHKFSLLLCFCCVSCVASL